MAHTTRTLDVCDGPCKREFPEGTLSVFPKGTRLGSQKLGPKQLTQDTMLCQACLLLALDVKPEVREVERVVYRDVPSSSSSSSSGSGRGFRATGRPFPSQASVMTTPALDWSTPLPSRISSNASSPGPASSPSASDARSTLLGRLLTCRTPAT